MVHGQASRTSTFVSTSLLRVFSRPARRCFRECRRAFSEFFPAWPTMFSFASVLLIAAAITCAADLTAPVPFPAEYRKWAVTRSIVVGLESKSFAVNGGFHHYYANPQAMEGFRTGQFPDGSVVVDERLDVRQEAGVTVEGSRKSVAVMEEKSHAVSKHRRLGLRCVRR